MKIQFFTLVNDDLFWEIYLTAKRRSRPDVMIPQLSYPEHFIEGDLFLKETAHYVKQLTHVMAVTITYCDDECWKRSLAGIEFGGISLPRMLYRVVIQRGTYIAVEDCLKHPTYKFINLNVTYPMIRFIACFPISNENGRIIGAITLTDRKPKNMTSATFASIGIIAKLIFFHTIKMA